MGGAVALAGVSHAQSGAALGVAAAVKQALKSQSPAPYSPLEPPYGKGLPAEQAGRLPGAGESDRTFRILKTGELSGTGDNLAVTGGAEMLIRGYHVFANEARGNRKTQIWELIGDVKVIGKSSVVSGERIVADFQNETFRSYRAKGQFDPEFLQSKRILSPVYIRGRESFGSGREVRSLDSDFTTCDNPNPHYELESQDSIVRVGKRAILRKVRFRLFDRTVFTLPFLVIPLEERNYKYTPEVGRSPDEGYYVKNRYGVPLADNRILDTRLDYMSKLGTGVGLGSNYESGLTRGDAKVYGITGQSDTLNFSNRHEQQFKFGHLQLENQFQRNNYLSAPGTTLLQNRATLAVPWGKGDSRLGYNRSNNQSSGFTTTSEALSINDNRSWGGGLRTSLDLNQTSNLQTFQGQASGKRQQIDVLFRGDQELRQATASLDYQRSIPIGDTTNFFSGSDRTPVVTLASDSKRLFGEKGERALPFRTQFSMGEYQGQTGSERISRSSFDFNFQKYDRSKNRFASDFTGQFRQGLYSDDTAQYLLNFGTASRYALGRDTGLNLRYNYLRPYGYTPLTIDRTGKTNLVTLDATVRTLRTFKIGVQTGYDINALQDQNTAWQQLGIRSEWQPRPYFLARALTNYDTFEQKWSSVRLDFSYRPGDTSVTLGARYDGLRQTWSNANLFLNNLKVGRTRISAIFAYNGYTRQFDSRQYSFTYDLHCAEAMLNIIENNTGFRAGREIQLLIRLKAFPFSTNFGNGRGGQPIGTSTGSDF